MQIGCGKGRNHHVSWALEILRRASSARISAAERTGFWDIGFTSLVDGMG